MFCCFFAFKQKEKKLKLKQFKKQGATIAFVCHCVKYEDYYAQNSIEEYNSQSLYDSVYNYDDITNYQNNNDFTYNDCYVKNQIDIVSQKIHATTHGFFVVYFLLFLWECSCIVLIAILRYFMP